MFAAVRRAGLGVAVVAALVTAGCAAGQQASTANERPTLDGADGSVGSINLRGLHIDAPTGSLVAYPVGSDVSVRLVIVNNGQQPDRLIRISSPAFSNWGTFHGTASAGQAAATHSSTPSHSIVIQPGTRSGWGTPEATGELRFLHTRQVLHPGTTVRVTFTFARAGTVTLATPIALASEINTSPIPTPAGVTGLEG